ncbi:CoA pyrophosphatase [Euzebyella marina]|uniref:CoA pyrophosphatase n=1 Tax=Euzebyella marina TaxID=1761453 RepID=A0A3G2L4D1_9FLAO|nr:CoA pyrophosphatase [Euzebyella marina]AYN67130.1 CoA pyrophosphatase [Euzebyella marina]MBG47256.1 coenzyme A pyrophosphatase [Pseudozobellia sp.]|tara:strand:- start:2685 stop:3329 length:645 start_codon:yes stop_codon:yes gene_type:complete
MKFDEFSLRIPKIKNLPLPGEASHLKMAPQFRIEELRKARQKAKNSKKAGVMALFYPGANEETHFLLILRKSHPKDVHSNQVGFPGGKLEKNDVDLAHTALRETQEEVGVDPNEIEIVRPLSEIYIPPSNFEVYPFLGLYAKPASFIPQVTEVAALVEVPLSQFLSDDVIFTQKLSTSYAKNVNVPAFKLNGYTVWGATSMMLSEIKILLHQVL